MKKLKTDFLENEYWWGGIVDDAFKIPLDNTCKYNLDLTVNKSYNQGSPLFLSSKGRFIWSDKGFIISFDCGHITVESTADIILDSSQNTLKEAYKNAQKRFFPQDGKYPNPLMFKVPQYCTWIELLSDQTEEGILSYAESIIKCNMPVGEIIIDNGWQKDYGVWEFDGAKFKDPKGMVQKLHDMGFKVILWIVPYVSPDTHNFQELREKDLLIKDTKGMPYILEWWEGFSAMLDFSNPAAVEWFRKQTDYLTNTYGIDGYKQDGGDARFHLKKMQCYLPECDANMMSELYALSALEYDFNEIRACFKCGGRGIAQRIADRHHTWDMETGLQSLIPNAALQGLLGYSYTCPDMVGGGLSSYFMGEKRNSLDRELFIRSCQCSALMPMMQLSFAFWRAFDKETTEICLKYVMLHAGLHDYIMECVQNSAVTGEPIIRNMAYQFNKGEKIKDQFMLGDDYLVAPVLNKGQTGRNVEIFEGEWEYIPTGEKYTAGCHKIDAPINILPYFKRIK